MNQSRVKYPGHKGARSLVLPHGLCFDGVYDARTQRPVATGLTDGLASVLVLVVGV